MSNLGEMGGGGGGSGGGFMGRKPNFNLTCSLLSQYLKEKGSFGELGLGMARTIDGKGKSEPPRTMNLLPGMEATGGQEHGKSAAATPAAAVPDLNATKPAELFSRQEAFFAPSAPADEAPKKPEIKELQAAAPKPAQMTIFYGGKVLVFDNFPAEKAKELMAMANKGNAIAGSTVPIQQIPGGVADHPNCPPARNASPTSTSTSGNNPVASSQPVPVAPAVSAPQDRPQKPPQVPVASDLPIARRVSLNRFLEKRKGRISSKAPYQVDGMPDNTSSSAGSPATGKADEKQPWLGAEEKQAWTSTVEEKKPWLGLATPSSSEHAAEPERRQ